MPNHSNNYVRIKLKRAPRPYEFTPRLRVIRRRWAETQSRASMKIRFRVFIEEGKFQMCDYSLFAIPNRLAKEQENLVAHRFPTGSMGLASPMDLRRNAQLRQEKSGSSGLWSAI